MLPSIRLIAATFFCGFVVVFAGLRIAASLNDIHEGLPVMAAHAAPIPAIPSADPAGRHGPSSAPVMYDLRFVATTPAFAPTLASLTTSAPPLDITPPPTERVTKEELPAPVGSIVAREDDTHAAATAAEPQSPPQPDTRAASPPPATAAPAESQP